MPIHTVASIYGVNIGVNTITTLRFMEDVPNVAARQALANAIRDRWMPNWKTGTSSAMNWLSIVISRQGDPNDSPYSLAVNIVGGGATQGPQQVAIQWNLFTGQAGKRGRGKLYLPGIATSAMALGKISGSTKLSMDAEVTTLIGRWCAGGSESYHLGVLSRVDDVLRPVVTLGYNDVFATLRSRRLGVGI